jgi:hypothetical protein
MANSYTANVKLAEPASGDRSWNAALNGDLSTIDSLATVGALAVTTHEVPSVSLKVDVAAGSFIAQDGSVQTFAGVNGQTIAASATRVLYLDSTTSWDLAVATDYPTTAHVRLATVATTRSAISTIVDNRQCFPAAGSIAEGVQITLGTVTGLQVGTSAGQKLGFFGKTPAVQPTMGAATASGTYGATEQAMLQAVYNAVRALGLGS